MLAINGVDGLDATVIPLLETDMGRVSRLVQNVVASNPWVSFVVLGKLFPQPDGTVLEVFVDPERGDVRWVIRVPVGILATSGRMVVEDGVDTGLGANINNTVEVLEPFSLEDARVHVIFEVAVVESNTNGVEAKRLVEGGIRLGEEVFEKLVPVEGSLFGAENIIEGLADLEFTARVTCDEVFLVHPSTKTCATQEDWVALAVDNLVALYLEDGWSGHSGALD